MSQAGPSPPYEPDGWLDNVCEDSPLLLCSERVRKFSVR